jgi:hypothetical protein
LGGRGEATGVLEMSRWGAPEALHFIEREPGGDGGVGGAPASFGGNEKAVGPLGVV